jgi:pimeloyl-ACP methyl ester carboxylesterase
MGETMPLFKGSEATLNYKQTGAGPDIVWVSGGGGTIASWDTYQLPYFDLHFRNTTFDGRGVGGTVADLPLPWTLEQFALDTAELIEATCDPPVALIGHSFGAGIAQQVALDYPDLLRCAIAIGTGARSAGWTWDYQMAEIEWRRAGHSFGSDPTSAMMAVCHYAAMYYPARVLGDRGLWPKLRDELLEYYGTDTNEASLIAQWLPCVEYDQTARLPDCRVPLHVVAFDQDVQAVPQDNEEVAALCPTAEYHLFDGMGHCSIYGHTHDVLNPFIKGLVERHL